MVKKSRVHEYVPPIPEDELSWRMGSSAGRKLEAHLMSQDWSAPFDGVDEQNDVAS